MRFRCRFVDPALYAAANRLKEAMYSESTEPPRWVQCFYAVQACAAAAAARGVAVEKRGGSCN